MLDTDVLFEHERVRKNTGTSTAPVSEAHWSTYSRLPHMWHEPRLANCSYAWSRRLCGVTRTVHPDIFRDTSFSTFFRGLVQNTKSRGCSLIPSTISLSVKKVRRCIFSFVICFAEATKGSIIGARFPASTVV